MRLKRLTLLFLLVTFLVFAMSGCRPSPSPTTILQEGNDLPKIQLQTKQSRELEDNHIGTHWSGLWQPLDWQVIFNGELFDVGLKRVRLAINDFDWAKADWDKPEFSIDPSHDNYITDIANNGIMITYVLTFWDKESRARGEEVDYPRFKTEDQIQRYLDFVRFIVRHFKDRVQYFEIWNEPTIRDSVQWIEVEDYINLVRRAVPVIRQEYPEAKVVVGGTDFLIFPESRDYLFSILESDVMPLVDAVSWHPMYGTSPEYEFHAEYYYDYPSIVHEIKDVASAHGFKGEYFADELTWRIPETRVLDQSWPHTYSETKCAKYLARGIVMHLGMDVTVGHGGAFPEEMPSSLSTVKNLCTIMAGAKPISLPIKIQSEATNIRSYGFSLPNGDKSLALWADGVAIDDDPGIEATLMVPGLSAEKVIGIDVLNGFEQQVITNVEGGDLVISNLLVKDYPIILRFTP